VRVRVVYLARLREALGRTEETLALPQGPCVVRAVLEQLRARGGPFAIELAAGRAFRVAVNYVMAHDDTPLREGDEVALLPPVTGG
jgi:molybdopterin synthase sulfur carrier subunit